MANPLPDMRGRTKPKGKAGNPNWVKGKSGNPKGGSTAVLEVTALAKQYTEVALKTLAQICEHGKSESARCNAASILLDRAYGRPRQAIEGVDGGPVKIEVVIQRFTDDEQAS
ncbi:MAG: hypothetical protein ACRDIC_20930 [bacterium]